jgi:hypothetical protein
MKFFTGDVLFQPGISPTILCFTKKEFNQQNSSNNILVGGFNSSEKYESQLG